MVDKNQFSLLRESINQDEEALTELIEKYGANRTKRYSQDTERELHRLVLSHVGKHFDPDRFLNFDEIGARVASMRNVRPEQAKADDDIRDDILRSTTLYNCTWFTKDADAVHALVERRIELTRRFVVDLNEMIQAFIDERQKDFLEVDRELSEVLNPAADYLIGKAYELRDAIAEKKKQLLNLQVEEMTQEMDGILPDKYNMAWLDEKKNLPHESGVYLLVRDGDLEYIGESEDIRRRITPGGHHIYDGSDAWVFGVILANERERKSLEKLLIKSLHPLENLAYVVDERQASMPL
jgi:hypothetical protein